MKTAMTSAFVFTAALALAGAASAHRVPSSAGADKPVAAAEADKKAKPAPESKDKTNCKHDKNHPCKGSDAKSGHTK